jgi:hypothetical protein
MRLLLIPTLEIKTLEIVRCPAKTEIAFDLENV